MENCFPLSTEVDNFSVDSGEILWNGGFVVNELFPPLSREQYRVDGVLAGLRSLHVLGSHVSFCASLRFHGIM